MHTLGLTIAQCVAHIFCVSEMLLPNGLRGVFLKDGLLPGEMEAEFRKRVLPQSGPLSVVFEEGLPPKLQKAVF